VSVSAIQKVGSHVLPCAEFACCWPLMPGRLEKAKLLTECRNFDVFTGLFAHRSDKIYILRGHIIASQMSVISYYFSFQCRKLEQFLIKNKKGLKEKYSLNGNL